MAKRKPKATPSSPPPPTADPRQLDLEAELKTALEAARVGALATLDQHVAKLRQEYAVTDDALLVRIVPTTTVADHLLKRREAVAHASTVEDLQAALVKAQRSALNTVLWLWAKQEVRGAATQLNLERHARRAEALAGLLESRGDEDAAARQRVRAEQLRKGEVPAPPTRVQRVSAASRFRELILAAQKSDDEIFKEVQAEFGLGDEKRSYVSWYRKDLIKKGVLKKEALREEAKAEAVPKAVSKAGPRQGGGAKPRRQRPATKRGRHRR